MNMFHSSILKLVPLFFELGTVILLFQGLRKLMEEIEKVVEKARKLMEQIMKVSPRIDNSLDFFDIFLN